MISKASAGFTLLEVMVALAILAGAFAALSALQARNLSLTAEDSALTRQTLAAYEIISMIQRGKVPIEDTDEELGDQWPGLRWRMKAEDSPLEDFLRVDITVYRQGREPEDGTTFWFLWPRQTQG